MTQNPDNIMGGERPVAAALEPDFIKS